MNDLFLLEPEYHYHAARVRRQLKSVRYRRWQRRVDREGRLASTDEKNWIS
ncbi:MAG: hypothetical protein WB797_05110 [Nocardioides sp.]